MHEININHISKHHSYLITNNFWYLFTINSISNIEWSMLKSAFKQSFGNTISLIVNKKIKILKSNFEVSNRLIIASQIISNIYSIYSTDIVTDSLIFENHSISNVVINTVGIFYNHFIILLETIQYYNESDLIYFFDYIYITMNIQFILINLHLLILSSLLYIYIITQFSKNYLINSLIYNHKFEISN